MNLEENKNLKKENNNNNNNKEFKDNNTNTNFNVISNKDLNEDIKKGITFTREILQYAYAKKQLSYLWSYYFSVKLFTPWMYRR